MSYMSEQQKIFYQEFKTIAPDCVADNIKRFSFAIIRELIFKGKGPEFQPEKVLELGCGDGQLLVRMQEAFPQARVVGVDISGKNVAKARQRGLEAFVYDVEEIATIGERYDLVYGSAILHHLEDLHKVFSGLVGIIRPGGCFVIGPEPSNCNLPYVILHVLRGTWKVEKGMMRISAGVLRKLMVGNGVRNIIIERRGNAFIYAFSRLGELYNRFGLSRICPWDDLYIYGEA